MDYATSDLVKEVRVVLDHNMEDTKLKEFGDTNTLTLDEIIESKLIDAANVIGENAPYYMVDNATNWKDESTLIDFSNKKIGSDIYIVSISLPSDYLRLVSIKMSDWVHDVKVETDSNSLDYELLFNEFSGVVGTPNNPRITVSNENKKVYLYCSEQGSTLEHFYYLPKIQESGENMNISTLLKRAIVYYAASLTAATYSDYNAMNVLQGIAYNLAHIPQQGKETRQ